MIVVTGTKRSGTSMWMQVLVGAGLPFIGEKFPARWKETIGAANPDGFFESRLRRGIYGDAAVDPLTGKPMNGDEYQHHVVKIFVRGLLRTDRRYLSRVLASMRDFREYEESRRRMWQMEDEARRKERPDFEPPARIEPVYEWWTSNYTLLVDSLKRRYDLKLVAYDTVLEDPVGIIRGTLKWLGHGDLAGALAAVKPEHRTQRSLPAPSNLESNITTVFDELYEMVRRERPLSRSLVSKLEAVNRTLLPRLKAELARIGTGPKVGHPTGELPDASHDDINEGAWLKPTLAGAEASGLRLDQILSKQAAKAGTARE